MNPTRVTKIIVYDYQGEGYNVGLVDETGYNLIMSRYPFNNAIKERCIKRALADNPDATVETINGWI